MARQGQRALGAWHQASASCADLSHSAATQDLSPLTQPCFCPVFPTIDCPGGGGAPWLRHILGLPGPISSVSEKQGRAGPRGCVCCRQMFLEPCFLFCCWAICFYSLSFLQGGFERLPLLQWMFPVHLHQAPFNENQFKVFFLIKCLIVAPAAPLWE